MLNTLHKKLLQKSRLYAKWHKNRFHTIVHFVVLFLIASIFAFYIQTGFKEASYYNLASQQAAYAKVVLAQLAPPSPLEGNLLNVGYGIFSLIGALIVFFGIAVFFVFLR